MAGIALDGNEGSVKRCASYRVIDHVEALACGVDGQVLLGRKRAVINGCCADRFDDVLFFGRNSGEDLRSEGLCQLDSDVPDSARARVD